MKKIIILLLFIVNPLLANNLEKQLFNSVLENDVGNIKKIIKKDLNLNAKDIWGETPLMKAIQLNNPEIVEVLLKAGADPNAVNRIGDTSLHYAVRMPEIVKLLINHKAEIDPLNSTNTSPLLYACTANVTQTIKILLENGANPNYRRSSSLRADRIAGYFPLLASTLSNNHEAVKLLLQYGANPNMRIGRYYSLDYAIKYKFLHIIALLEKVTKKEKFLIDYVAEQDLDGVIKSIQSGTNINQKDNFDYTPLFYAIYLENKIIVKKLIENGADVNVNNAYGESLLNLVIRKKDIEILSMVVKSGKGKFDQTLLNLSLLRATQFENTKAIPLLIEAGADINSKVPEYTRTFLISCSSGSLLLFQEFIKNGADVGEYGNACFLEIPILIETEEEIELRIELGVELGVKLEKESGMDKQIAIAKAKLLLSKGIDINYQNEYGYTALMIAARNGQEDYVVFLLKNGAKKDLKNKDGFTARDLALKNDYPKTAKYLK